MKSRLASKTLALLAVHVRTDGGCRWGKHMHRHPRPILHLIALLFALPWALARAGGEEPIHMLPSDIGQGGELAIFVNGQPGGADRQLQFRFADGSFTVLADLVMDPYGDALARAPLPDVPPGDYFVDLSDYSRVIASARVTVHPAPQVTLTPADGYGSQAIGVEVTGLTPGTVVLTVDGVPEVGPLAVAGNDLSTEFVVPRGGAAALEVAVENRVGDRLMGRGSAVFQRNRTQQTTVESLSINLPTEPFRRGELREITGELLLPDGDSAEDYEWTFVWRQEDGTTIPINVEPVEFTQSPAKGFGNVWQYAVKVVTPSPKTGFIHFDFDQDTDELGFVYVNPRTGGFDYRRASQGPLDIDDEFGIVINGRVINAEDEDPATNGIEDAIVAIEADTKLIKASDAGKDPFEIIGGNKGGPPPMVVSRAMGVLIEETQFAEAFEKLFLKKVITDTGCPVTLNVQQTGPDGQYSIAFSAAQTQLLSLLRDMALDPTSGTFVPTGEITRDRFAVRISALHLDDAFGVPVNPFDPNSFTGVRYDFERKESTGQYFFRDSLDGPFDQPFDPLDTLETELLPVPPGVSIEISATISLEGLDPGNEMPVAGIDRLVFDGLVTFPGQAGNPTLNTVPVTLRLPWLITNFGFLDGVVKLNGVGSFPLLLAEGSDPCDPAGAVYTSQLIGLAVAKGPIKGRIEAVAGETLFYKDIEIRTIDGPTWFETNAAAYNQPVNIVWDPKEIKIVATEVPKSVDASNDINEVAVGQVDNNNDLPAASVRQTIVSGAFQDLKRSAGVSVTVFNESPNVQTKTLALTGASTAFAEERVFRAPVASMSKTAREDLENRPDAPDFSLNGKDPKVVFDSGKIPLFRYAWGVPPIAAATLGADLYFITRLLYYGYIDTPSAGQVSVNSITEPSSNIGLDVFFDFSAVLGLVNATMTATPEVGVALPLIITNSLFNAVESKPCFQFLLKLKFEVSVGPCPLCISGSYNKTPVNKSEPPSCSVPTSKGLVNQNPPPIADSLALATNDAGTAFAVMSDEGGMFAQQILTGVPATTFLFDTGPGAMKPAVAFYRADAAVAVWSQSSLSQAEYDAAVANDYDCDEDDVLADPNCDAQSQFDEHQFQQLVYAQWDGFAWGPTQVLTPPSGGDGGVALAACRETEPLCPPGGEVLAVWHRDMDGDLSQHRVKLFYAFFDGMAWSPPTEIDPVAGAKGTVTATTKDVQPAPIYYGGSPLVAWVRNDQPVDSNGDLQLDTRYLVYNFLSSGAGTQVMPNVPESVASPSIKVAANGTIVLAFSANNALIGDPFIGGRQALYSAVGTNCNAGTCQWFSLKQLDQHGREIYVEHPKVVLGPNDDVMVFYRWLGTQGDLLPTDPFGVAGYGDTAMHALALPEVAIQDQANVGAITADGNVNWQVAAVYDPSIQGLLALSAQGFQEQQLKAEAAKLGLTARPMAGVKRYKMASTRNVALFQMPAAADLAITGASAGGVTRVAPDDVLELRVTLANLAQPLGPGQVTTIEAWWNGPPGVGTLLHTERNVVISDPVGTEVAFSVDVPTDALDSVLQTLHLVVNRDRSIGETDASNNGALLEFNALPVAENLDFMLDLGGTTVLLTWDDPRDERVTNFRVYRRDLGQIEVIQAGVSPRMGFLDVLARPDAVYEYCVAAMTAAGTEGECSEWLLVPVEEIPTSELFTDGFE